ncbi:MAG: serine/threonine protein kinase, partial [Thermoleophilia bacterium]|nr:serine/threonine protein kinase [Thermoleophilia bacterium]
MAQVRHSPEGHWRGDAPQPADGSHPDDGSANGAALDAHAPALRGYEILGEIGRGGLALVYKARRKAGGQVVAVKMLTAGAASSEADRARFKAEAESLSRLSHPNIVQIHELGENAGLPWFAMEYMDLGSLAHSLGNAPLPPRYAAELLVRLCRGVQAAHDAGILHRDIKPANVLLASPTDDASPLGRLLGVPKLTDFGIAKRLGEDNRLTRTGSIMGTPAYMAPEQAEGNTRQATGAVDVYSLGAVLYECLTGRPPYQADTVLATLDQVRAGDPLPPDQVAPGVPAALATVCLKAMAREPGNRYPSADAMAEDLTRWLSDEPVRARREPAWSRAAAWIRKQPVVAALGAGLAVLTFLLGFLLVAMWKRSGREAPNAERTEHYGAVVRRWGVPEGVHPLAAADVARREVSFRFRLKGRHVERVEAIDRHGRPTTAHSFAAYLERGDGERPFRRSVRWEYQRDEEGNVVRETALDRTGQV